MQDRERLDFDYVKNFLKADDYTNDDDFIKLLIEAALEFLINATRKDVNEKSASAKLLMLAFISTLYNNRELTIDAGAERVQATYRSLITHLQYGGEGLTLGE